MRDCFGHNGGTADKRFGVVGLAGRMRFLVTASQMVVGVYADPQIGSLHVTVPLPHWPFATCNDERAVDSLRIQATLNGKTRGSFNAKGEWSYT